MNFINSGSIYSDENPSNRNNIQANYFNHPPFNIKNENSDEKICGGSSEKTTKFDTSFKKNHYKDFQTINSTNFSNFDRHNFFSMQRNMMDFEFIKNEELFKNVKESNEDFKILASEIFEEVSRIK